MHVYYAQKTLSSFKHLAAIRMLFDRLATGQVVATNTATPDRFCRPAGL